jgi:hypothetical protein
MTTPPHPINWDSELRRLLEEGDQLPPAPRELPPPTHSKFVELVIAAAMTFCGVAIVAILAALVVVMSGAGG